MSHEPADEAVIVRSRIEHMLEATEAAIGPEGGDGGGTIVATGTTEDVAKNRASHTGRYLKGML